MILQFFPSCLPSSAMSCMTIHSLIPNWTKNTWKVQNCTNIQKHIGMITKSIYKRNRPVPIGRLQNGLSKGTHRRNGLYVMLGESGLTSLSNSLPEAFPSHTCSTSFRSGGRPYWVCSKQIITDPQLSHYISDLPYNCGFGCWPKSFLDVNNSLDWSDLVPNMFWWH